MTEIQEVHQLETRGYVVLPKALANARVAELRERFATLPCNPVEDNPPLCSATWPPVFLGEGLTAAVETRLGSFLERLLGDGFQLTQARLIRSPAGSPNSSFSTDYRPYGGPDGDWSRSCAVRVCAIVALEDFGPERAGFAAIPGSHCSFHAAANPYLAYTGHPEAESIPLFSGDILLVAPRLFLARAPNTGSRPRDVLYLDFRPAWARPLEPVPEWSPADTSRLPEGTRRIFRARNFVDREWAEDTQPAVVGLTAKGLGPDRWGEPPGSGHALRSDDFAQLTPGERVRRLELDGYVLLPDLVSEEQRKRIRSELADMPMGAAWYNRAPTWGSTPPQWYSRACGELIGHPSLVSFLTRVFGEDVVFVHGHFLRSTARGGGAMPLIANSQPLGSALYGWRNSSPVTVRTLTYLHDAAGVFRVVPGSHLSFHRDANPYLRYEAHPAEVQIVPSAGDVLLFAGSVFHGGGPGIGGPVAGREIIEMTYRPLWARPVRPMQEWTPEEMARAPREALPYVRSTNAGADPGRHLDAEPLNREGLGPSRWQVK